MMEGDPARDDLIVLVDGLDRTIGYATKKRAHTQGLLHRAFSVLLVRGEGADRQVLLAQRARQKYHSGGLWANSCCSHPRKGEDVMEAARRRLPEELGVQARDLSEIGSFAYRAVFDNGLVEFEYDHVLLGTCEGEPRPEPNEVEALRWVGVGELARMLCDEPELFSAWAPMVLSMALQEL